MLVLNRHENEWIDMPGLGISICVVEIRGNVVRLGFDAPRSIAIHRREVAEAIALSGGERSSDMRVHAKCPRCGNEKAKPNARGPDHVWCMQCGGFVPVDYADEEHGPWMDDPVRSAIANEQGIDKRGKIRDDVSGLFLPGE